MLYIVEMQSGGCGGEGSGFTLCFLLLFLPREGGCRPSVSVLIDECSFVCDEVVWLSIVLGSI